MRAQRYRMFSRRTGPAFSRGLTPLERAWLQRMAPFVASTIRGSVWVPFVTTKGKKVNARVPLEHVAGEILA